MYDINQHPAVDLVGRTLRVFMHPADGEPDWVLEGDIVHGMGGSNPYVLVQWVNEGGGNHIRVNDDGSLNFQYLGIEGRNYEIV